MGSVRSHSKGELTMMNLAHRIGWYDKSGLNVLTVIRDILVSIMGIWIISIIVNTQPIMVNVALMALYTIWTILAVIPGIKIIK